MMQSREHEGRARATRRTTAWRLKGAFTSPVFLACLTVSVLICGIATGAEPKDDAEIRVLFIGNSLTFGGPQWELFEGFADADAGCPKVKTGYHMRAATTLTWFWEKSWWKSDYKTAQKAIAAEKWTHVVLQPYGSDYRHDNIKILDEYFAAIEAVGAQPVLYCTAEGVMEVADAKAKEKLEKAEATLLKAVRGHNAWIVPAKRAAFMAKHADPQVQIRRPKGGIGNVHPGAVGHYLIAACFYPVLSGRQVVGSSFVTPDSVIGRLDDTEAAWLQNVAWQALVSFHQEHGIGTGYTLPQPPDRDLLVPVDRPEAKPLEKRIERDLHRRYQYIMADWRQAEKKCKRWRFKMHRKQKAIKHAFQLLHQVRRDYPDRELTPELKQIKAKLLALPQEKE